MPTGTLATLYSPVFDVFTVRVNPFSGSVTVTVAPDTTAPLVSTTEPKMLPVF